MILRCMLPGGQVEEIDLDKRAVSIGRAQSSDLTVVHPSVSRMHCKISRRGPEYLLEDSGSRNGTFVNGKKIKRASLKVGDKISVGSLVISVEPRAEKAGKALVDEVHDTMRTGMGYKAIMANILKEAKNARAHPPKH